jgi:PAS domain S-box-containing protein
MADCHANFGFIARLLEGDPRQAVLLMAGHLDATGSFQLLPAWTGVGVPAQVDGCLLGCVLHDATLSMRGDASSPTLLPGLTFPCGTLFPLRHEGACIGMAGLGGDRLPQPADSVLKALDELARIVAIAPGHGPAAAPSTRASELFLTELSSDLVSLPPQAIQAGIERWVARLGQLCGADRSYLFRFTDEGNSFLCDSEWCAEGITPTNAYFAPQPVAPYDWALSQLLRGEVLSVPDIAALPESAWRERETWTLEGSQSLLNVPLSLGGHVLGFVGLDAVRTRRDWSEKTVALLTQSAEILAHALDRWHVAEEQQVRLEFLQGMERLNNVIQRNTALDTFLPDAMDEVRRILRVDRAWLLQLSGDGMHMRVIAESTTPAYPGALALGVEIPIQDDRAAVLDRLYNTEGPILLGPGGMAPPAQSAQAFGVLSEVHMLLRPRAGDPWIFGLHQCAEERRWRPAEIELFRSVGYRLTDAIGGMLLWRELHTSEARFRAFMENNPAMAFIKDPEGRYLYGNPAWQAQFGKTWDELAGLTDHDLFPASMAGPIRASDLAVLDARVPMHFTQDRLNLAGEPISLSIHKFPVVEANGAMLLGGLIIDVSDVRRAQESLERSEARFRALTENTSEITVILDAARRFKYVSPAIQKALGVRSKWVLGKPLTEAFHPEDQEIVHVAIDRAYRNPGQTIVIEEFRVPHRAGHWVVFEAALTAMPEAPGVHGLVANCRDISDRKRAQEEQQRLQDQIQHTQKLESLGVLAGGIAHDFNNLLVGIMGNADMARLHLPPEEPAYGYLAGILKSTHRAADLCRQMLAYSGRGHFVIETLDLNEVVREMLDLLQVSISKKAALSLELAGFPCTIQADATQVRQVIMNLITNASEAMGDAQGRITLTSGVRSFSAEDFVGGQMGAYPPPGRFVYLEVADTGTGMDPETMQKMYDPFFTTKFTGRGLGMAAVLGIVRGHGGAILCRSALGVGTTFSLLFPAAAAPVSEVDPGEPVAATVWQGQGCVLVVDDEPVVRRIAGLMLEQMGLSTMEAANGREAVALLAREPDAVTCVLLDMTMPVMSGDEAFRLMRQIRPGLPIILMSGYNEQDATKRLEPQECSAFLQKPYQMTQLAATLAALLGAPVGPIEP